MKSLIQLIDEDVVESLNSGRRAVNASSSLEKLRDLSFSLYAPRLSWIKLIAPLMVLPVLLVFLNEPIKTYWMFTCFGATLGFFGLYFYRFALIRQRWLDNHQVDEFGATIASPGDLYEIPSD